MEEAEVAEEGEEAAIIVAAEVEEGSWKEVLRTMESTMATATNVAIGKIQNLNDARYKETKK